MARAYRLDGNTFRKVFYADDEPMPAGYFPTKDAALANSAPIVENAPTVAVEPEAPVVADEPVKRRGRPRKE